MANRTANYSAFYVKTPFNESNLGANATPDFVPSEKPQKKIGCYVQNSTVRCAVTEEVNLS